MNNMKISSRVWVEVDGKALLSNFRNIHKSVSPCSVIVVMKANAYGLGVRDFANVLKEENFPVLAVAELREAMELLDFGHEVMILGSVLPEEIACAVEHDIVLPLSNLEMAKRINAEGKRCKKVVKCHFVVDSGMGRLGFLLDNAFENAVEISKMKNIKLDGIYSHFPIAYKPGSEFTNSQIKKVCKLIADLATAGIHFKWRHIANSDGINNFPESYMAPFNAVRTGIGLHGTYDLEGNKRVDLKPIATLKTRLTEIRELPAGTSIGYGQTYVLPRKTLVGVISAGYADGLPLALSNRGSVIVNGCLCPILGRVSMDYTTISLEQVANPQLGDEVICIGEAGGYKIALEDWACLKNTHPYDIICSFGGRVERFFYND
ncbi:MAG: alanine racemase [Kiritimatiellae bacterium]|jgi:alanine racemase|nr:alanine racemase [Kiritimatiellia bacterium]